VSGNLPPIEAPADEELMRAYLAGDSSAFDALYRRLSGRVYGYLHKRLQNRESADEVFQAVFFKFHRSRSHYDFAYPVAQWLFVIAKTSLMDHFRKSGRSINVVDEELNPELVSQNDPAPALDEGRGLEVLSGLAPDQRQAIEMRVVDELSYDEIATKLNRSQESVRQLISRGLKKLRGASVGRGGL
jgi:RNA polymerase sigma-70 factor (ECF subfamily)